MICWSVTQHMIELVNKLIQWSGWSWRWHVLAIVVGAIVGVAVNFLPLEWFKP